MKTKVRINKAIWILTCVLLLAGITYAAAGRNNGNQASNQPGSEQKSDSKTHALKFFSVKQLTGSDVKHTSAMEMDMRNMNPDTTRTNEPTRSNTYPENPTRETRENDNDAAKIGTVKDVVIDYSQQKIKYVIVDSGDMLHPIPWTAFNFSGIAKASAYPRTDREDNVVEELYDDTVDAMRSEPERRLILYLDMTRQELDKAPVIQSVSIDRFNDQKMRQDLENFYSRYIQKNTGSTSERPNSMVNTPSSTPNPQSTMNFVLASKIYDYKLRGTSDEDLKIGNIIAEAPQGRVLYALVKYGGFLNIGEKTAAVPWQAVTIDTKGENARINASRDKLDTVLIDPDEWYRLAQPQFARRIYSSFGVQPSPVYGFAPGEMDFSAWKPDSEYNKHFDKNKMTTIAGTVQNVGTYEPASGAAPGVELTIQANDGKTYAVYAGPQEYAKEKDFTWKNGDQVEIKGSTSQMNNKSVILASEIKMGDKTLSLYENDGKPKWDTDKLMQHSERNEE